MTAGLTGITVVDLTQGVSGPFCTRLLSQMGARVLKIERPGGGDLIRLWDDIVNGMCSGHAWVNPGKESVALNLKTEEGREVLMKLVERADVMIENFAPGQMEDWGLTYDKIKAAKPDIIFCRISGFGQNTPYRDRTALDLIVQGETGLIMTNGTPEVPAKLSLSVCDISGSMYATIGILEALFHRQRTGRGQKVEISMMDTVLTWTGYFPYMHWYAGKLPERVGLHHHTMAPYGPYRCSDGRMVIVAAGSGHVVTWHKFCEAIGRLDLFDNPLFTDNNKRLAHRSKLDQEINAAISQHDREHWIERFKSFGIPAGALNDLSEGLNHPAVVARGLIKEVDSAVGKIKVLDFPPQFTELESVNELGPPLVGEHTRKVLHEIGINDAAIDAMGARGVVECAN